MVQIGHQLQPGGKPHGEQLSRGTARKADGRARATGAAIFASRLRPRRSISSKERGVDLIHLSFTSSNSFCLSFVYCLGRQPISSSSTTSSRPPFTFSLPRPSLL